jgi:hypothetical protein
MIWVSMKGGPSPKVKSVKTISSDFGKLSLDNFSAPPKKKSSTKVHAVVSSPPAVDSKGPFPGEKPYFKGGEGKKGADNKGKVGGGEPKTDGGKGTGTGNKLQRFLNLRYWSTGGDT